MNAAAPPFSDVISIKASACAESFSRAADEGLPNETIRLLVLVLRELL